MGFLFIGGLAFGQSNLEDTVVLYTAIQKYAGNRTIIYIDSINKERKLPASIAATIKKGKVKDIDDPNKCLRLTNSEVKYLHEHIATLTAWNDHLFANSRRVNADSMWVALSASSAWRLPNSDKQVSSPDSPASGKSKNTYQYVFTFTKPIYIRNNKVCYFTWAALCGGECGYLETSFFKKKNNKWVKWITVSAGNF